MPTIASELPDPRLPEFPALVAVLFAFIGAAANLWRTGDWEAAERAAFKAGFVGTGFGILAYLIGLITGLY